MMMNMKRFTEIGGREALERLTNGLDVYTDLQSRVYMDGNNIYLESHGMRSTMGDVKLRDFLDETWYVKKPFDVRAEMLARPNEWVGAFKNSNGEWMMIGFNENKFGVSVRFLEVPILYSPNAGSSGGYGVTKDILDGCIPIEDVPKSEL